ncbi:MAG: hypothetical protein J5I98_14155 [Phaeodactylibacter sp.]|nr:hypothetical protein [Phaeodactylibacter sp.]
MAPKITRTLLGRHLIAIGALLLVASGLHAQEKHTLRFTDTAVLKPQNEVSEEVLAYERELKRLTDSIAVIQDQLIAVIEHPASNTRTKEKAVNVLAGIHNEQVVEYLLKTEKNLRFGPIDPLDDDLGEETARTAMIAIYKEYFSRHEVNWIVFPFLLKHIDAFGFSEIGIVRRLYGYGDERFKAPWLLLEFMHANANPALKRIIEGELNGIKIPDERKK